MDDDYSSTDSSSDSTSSTPPPSPGILMLSLSDSFDDYEVNNTSADHDVFQTPPESALIGTSQDKTRVLNLNQISEDDEEVGDFGDGSGVDLERDTDLVVSDEEVMEFKVLKREFSSTAESSSPAKKLRVSEHDSEESETERLSLSSGGSDSDHTLEIAGDEVKSEEKQKKNVVEDSGSSEGTQPISEESGSPSGGVEYSYEEGGKVNSREVHRVLPLSFCPPAEEETNEWSFLLTVLKLLKDKEKARGDYDNEIDKCSFVEIAKRRGITFPRP